MMMNEEEGGNEDDEEQEQAPRLIKSLQTHSTPHDIPSDTHLTIYPPLRRCTSDSRADPNAMLLMHQVRKTCDVL
jgi:hypothetical protein